MRPWWEPALIAHMGDRAIRVIKLGGSLLDLPDLASRLASFVATCGHEHLLLVVGGGRVADVVRSYDATYALDEETGHWIAVRAMQLNTYLVASILPRCRTVCEPDGCQAAWQVDDVALVDPLRWLENEHARGVTVPHRWSFTSDSIAAHIAVQLQAGKLTLLKSTVPGGVCDVGAAVRAGLVDADFAGAAGAIGGIELVNLRSDPPARCVLRSRA